MFFGRLKKLLHIVVLYKYYKLTGYFACPNKSVSNKLPCNLTLMQLTLRNRMTKLQPNRTYEGQFLDTTVYNHLATNKH
jgi:hypothetical protein